MPSFSPILVWPLPSGPWHLVQFFSQFSFASAAEAWIAAAKPITVASRINFFIVGDSVFSWNVFALPYRVLREQVRRGRENPLRVFWPMLCIFCSNTATNG